MEQTLIQLIEEAEKALQDMDALGPAEASKKLAEISSLYSSCVKETVDAEVIYRKKRAEIFSNTRIVGQVNIIAESTPEYERWAQKKANQNRVLEMKRGLKSYVNYAETEKRESIYHN